MRIGNAPYGRVSVVVKRPRVVISRPARIFYDIPCPHRSARDRGAWELFDAATFDEYWMMNRLIHIPGGDPRNAKGALLLPTWGTVVRSGLTLRSLPRGGSASFRVNLPT